jgi:hypothetical protein
VLLNRLGFEDRAAAGSAISAVLLRQGGFETHPYRRTSGAQSAGMSGRLLPIHADAADDGICHSFFLSAQLLFGRSPFWATWRIFWCCSVGCAGNVCNGLLESRCGLCGGQGLSEVPYVGDVERWGIFTIGTGLGNARFTNREVDGER